MTMLTGKARLAGVMGWPVSHSQSPRLHGFWLQRYGIDGAYVPLLTAPETAADAMRALPKLGFRGANVTVPHKETALTTADHLTPRAARIGAVNTLIVKEDGSLLGDNTDGYGFLQNLMQGAPAWQAAAGPAVVLGAGGASRAVVAALLDAGVPSVRLLNRSRHRADGLAAALGAGVEVFDWEDRAAVLDGAAVLVNTTTLGMTGQPPLDISLVALPASAVVTDIVYAPLMTPLLVAAQARGLAVVDGLGMLLHQARPGFKAWFGPDPQVDDALRAHVLAGMG